jgi:TonB family protein
MLEVIKATAVLAAAFAATLALRRASAALRHMVWTVAMVCLLALPILSRILPAWSPAVVQEAIPAFATPMATVVVGTVPAAGRSARQPLPWLFVVWAAGALTILARVTIGMARMRWLLRRSRAPQSPEWSALLQELSARLGVRRAVMLRQSHGAAMPMTWGFLRPVIVLPAASGNWTADRRRVVLLHELAHIRRLDHLTYLAAQLARAVYWFHPLIWPAAACFRKEQERACDDAVLRLGARGPDYAKHLVELARGLQARPAWPAALSMAHSSNLEPRIKAMLNPKLNRKSITKVGAALLLAAAACILLPLASIGAPQAAAGRLLGTVFDFSGAVIPDATVVATNLDTHTRDMTTADQAGDYAFRSLPAGRYVVEVNGRGFAPSRKEILLTAGGAQQVDMTLNLGSVSETVTIVATAPRRIPASQPAGAPRRIRVGGNVQATRLVYQAKPVYPEGAKEQGIQGTVVMRAVIGLDGALLSLEPISTQADAQLVQAAMDAAKQWRYQPTLLNGVPVEVATQITVNFRLSQ